MWLHLVALILLGSNPLFVPDSLWVRGRQAVLPCPWHRQVEVVGAEVQGWRGDTLLLGPLHRDSVKVRFLRWAACDTLKTRKVPRSADSGALRAGVPGPRMPASAAPAPEALWFRGFKTFTVAGGPGTPARFQQAAQVQFQGRVGRFRVSGVLNDQNLSATGTEELSALDRLLLSFQGPGWSAHLGDLDLAAASRPLRGRGGSVRWALRPVRLEAAYVLRRGDPRSVEIPLRDGDPGPYFLDPDRKPVQVLSGSERVYLNGTQLRPGDDYLLDDRTGTLVFTPRIRVQHTDHLRVEFEQLQAFPGRTLGLLALTSPRDSAWQVQVLQDGYDPAALRSFLSPLDLERLTQLGDTSGTVMLDGGIQVGPGRGEYVREDSVYRYVGPGQGDYRVFFEFVGEGQGAYRYDAVLGGYRFVGQGHGAYVPRIRQPVPSRLRWLEMQARPVAGGWVRLGAEEVQPNVLFPRWHREGEVALRWHHRFDQGPLAPEIQVWGVGVSRRYRRPEGTRVPPDLAARYRLQGTERGPISAGGLRLSVAPGAGWRVIGEVERLRLGDRRGAFHSLQTRLERAWARLQVFGEETRLPDGDRWRRYGLVGELRRWTGRPTLQALVFRSDTLAYRELGLRWSPGSQQLELHGRQVLQSDRREVWALWQGRWPWIHLEAQGFYRRGEPEVRFLARADWHRGPWTGHHEIGRGALSETGVRYVYVGPGQGDYGYDPATGEYHPDPHGAYRRETLPLGALQGASRQRHSLELFWPMGPLKHQGRLDWQIARSGAQEERRLNLEYTGTRDPWTLTLQHRREQHPTLADAWSLARLERRLGRRWQVRMAYETRESQGTFSVVRRQAVPSVALAYTPPGFTLELRALDTRVWPVGRPGYRNPRGELRWQPALGLPARLRLTGALTLGYGFLNRPLPAGWTPVMLGVESGPYLTGHLQLSRNLGRATTLSLTASGDRRRGMPGRLYLSATLNLAF